MDIDSVRKNYPALQQQTYLNTASCGIVSQDTAAAAQQVYQELLQHGGVPRAGWYEQMPALRQELAEWLDASADEITLLPNFSIASNYVAQALASNQRVLLVEGDYSSLTMPWLLHHCEVHYFSADANGWLDLERLEKAMEDHAINVLAISHVQYTTGFCVDLEALGQICQARGVRLVVDATQSLGVMPIDLERMRVDVLMGSGYKWMSAGFGNALLYIRRELAEQLEVVAVGNNSFDGFPHITSKQDIDFSARTLEVGHHDFSSLLALRQALHTLRDLGQERISLRVQGLTTYLCQQLPPGAELVSDYPAANRSGITVIKGDYELEKTLLKQRVVTSARAQGLRISLHFYNNESDIDRLCDVLAETLKN